MRAVAFVSLFCVLTWQTQAQQTAADTSMELRVAANAATDAKGSKIQTEEPVISIKSTCAESSVANSECNSVITRSQFESLVQFIQPNWSMAQRRQFASSYADALVLSEQAQQMGLDKEPRFNALMKMQRDFVLQYLLNQTLQEKANQVPEADIEARYNASKEDWGQVELEPLYIPLTQQISTAGIGHAEAEKRQKESVVTMNNAAHELRMRALKGEEFATLQTEAYKLAGYGAIGDLPKGKTETRRSGNLPASQRSLLDLRPGQVSQVFEESNGYFVYKLVRREALPLSAAREEIKETLRGERLREYQKKAHESGAAILNEAYFRESNGARHTSNEP